MAVRQVWIQTPRHAESTQSEGGGDAVGWKFGNRDGAMKRVGE